MSGLLLSPLCSHCTSCGEGRAVIHSSPPGPCLDDVLRSLHLRPLNTSVEHRFPCAWRSCRRTRTKMSVAVKGRINAKHESRKCKARWWRLFPHLVLCLSLVVYAALGALLFQHIEGGSASATRQDYHGFLGQIISTVQNLTGTFQRTTCPVSLMCVGRTLTGPLPLRELVLLTSTHRGRSGEPGSTRVQVHLAAETRQMDLLWLHVLLLHRVHNSW